MNDHVLPPAGRIRRALTGAGLLALAPVRRLLAQAAPGTSTHLSIAEPPRFWNDPPGLIAQRFALYQAAGVRHAALLRPLG